MSAAALIPWNRSFGADNSANATLAENASAAPLAVARRRAQAAGAFASRLVRRGFNIRNGFSTMR